MTPANPVLPAGVLALINTVAETARQHDVTSLEIELLTLKVQLKRARAQVQVVPPVPVSETVEPSLVPVTSEMVGVYRPGKVQKGAMVKAGDVVAYIESMSLMNEVRAPQDGRVTEILVEPGHPVEYGQVLIALLPSKE